MSLIFHSSSTLHFNNPSDLLHRKSLHVSFPKPSRFSIKSQDSSSDAPISDQSTDDKSSPPKPNSTGLGFGSSTPSASPVKKKQGKKERAAVIRRAPVEKPKFAAVKDESKSKEQGKDEQAFLLAWLGLGSVIFLQGILLSISGFLPEELDNLCVKYVYPAFTPTVVFFFAGTIVYGVSKYLQNEKENNQNL
ncbi:protein LPA2 [Apium graveolens]|uniref:protein LPA2 n=1 Tax=Apium graveolens TaxID=4045 RepID=UPI003D7B5E79